MPCSQVAPEACLQADRRTFSLAGSLRGLGCTIYRAVVRAKRRSICKVATCPPTPPLPPSEIGSPSSPNEDLLCQHHSELARRLCPSLSSICNWLQEDDIRIIGVLPVSGGGFAELWKGSLENRQVAIKSYRHYLTTDPSRISAVSRLIFIAGGRIVEVSSVEICAGSAGLQPPFTQTHRVLPRGL